MDDFNPNTELKVTKAMLNDRPTRKNRKHKKKTMSRKDKTAIKNLVKKLVAIERKENAKIKNKKACKKVSIEKIVNSRTLNNIAKRKRRGSKKKKKTVSDIAPPVLEQPSQVETMPVDSNDEEMQTEQPVETEPVNSMPENEVVEEPQSITGDTPTEEPEKPKENSVLESVENSMSSVASAVGLGSNSAESEKKKEENKTPTGGRRRSKKGKGKGKK
jgi:hypothetical protein